MEEQEFARCRDDVTYFVRRYCHIRHPLRGSVAFALWDWQAELLDMLTREQLLIVLKARQLGVSELGAAYALWRARFIPGWLGLLVSRNQSDAGDLLDRIGFMYDHLPPWLQAGPARTGRGTTTRQREHDDDDSVPPLDGLVLRKRNTSVLEFGHVSADGVVPSRIQSLPATKGTGRGKPASWVFLDEWAHQPWQSQIFAAIKPTLSAGGALLGVSTANVIPFKKLSLPESGHAKLSTHGQSSMQHVCIVARQIVHIVPRAYVADAIGFFTGNRENIMMRGPILPSLL